jgi:hypothetical protein
VPRQHPTPADPSGALALSLAPARRERTSWMSAVGSCSTVRRAWVSCVAGGGGSAKCCCAVGWWEGMYTCCLKTDFSLMPSPAYEGAQLSRLMNLSMLSACPVSLPPVAPPASVSNTIWTARPVCTTATKHPASTAGAPRASSAKNRRTLDHSRAFGVVVCAVRGVRVWLAALCRGNSPVLPIGILERTSLRRQRRNAPRPQACIPCELTHAWPA